MAALRRTSWPLAFTAGRHTLSRTTRRTLASAVAVVQEYPSRQIPTDHPDQLAARRREAIKKAKPFSSFLTDSFRREHNYLRISLTEKCNLRCLYCMPEEGVPQSPRAELLTTPEIFLLSSTFVSQGVTKIRLTGGEPTVRRDILPLMYKIGSLRSKGLRELCLTTNGISLYGKLDSMVDAGLTGVNLSLDTLDPWQFQIMTRRKGFDAVMKSMNRIIDMNKAGAGIKLKINCVVMRGMNEKEIIPFVELGRNIDLEIRFIEYMPFDGNKWTQGKLFSYKEMLDTIRGKYPTLRKVQDHKNDTSKTYEIPGFAGRVGFVTSMTHNFCGTCNRLRITSDGNLKVCLFGNAEVSLRDILRKSNNGNPIDEEAFEAMKKIEMDRQKGLDPTAPLARPQNEQELLDVIGLAVSRKKAKHAGMGELENMKNRPMILIDELAPKVQTSQIRTFLTPHHELWKRIPFHLLCTNSAFSKPMRAFSTSTPRSTPPPSKEPTLTHVTTTGTSQMVSISHKSPTARLATAVCNVFFSTPSVIPLIRANQLKKGDVLAVARIAGIMAAKRTPDLIPLCHPIPISHVSVELETVTAEEAAGRELQIDTSRADESSDEAQSRNSSIKAQNDLGHGTVAITVTVSCDGKTGVEMEALTAANVAALTVYDMCKAVDKAMRIDGLRVIRKEGGKSGLWVDGVSIEE